MLNNSYWKEYNDGERAVLWSTSGAIIAHIQKKETVWDCLIYPKSIAESLYYNGMSSVKEVEWQVTLYIDNKCRKIANQLYEIRDSLPSLYELAGRAAEEEEKLRKKELAELERLKAKYE